MPGDPDDLTGCHVEEHRAGRRQFVERLDPPPGDDLAAERTEVRSQGFGEILGSAPDDRPADGVAGQPEDEPDGRGRPELQRQDRVGRQAGEEGLGRFVDEPAPGQPRRRLDRPEAEPCRTGWDAGAASAGR